MAQQDLAAWGKGVEGKNRRWDGGGGRGVGGGWGESKAKTMTPCQLKEVPETIVTTWEYFSAV